MSLEGGQETWVEKERETVWTKSLQRGRERKEMCRWHMNACTQHTHPRTHTYKCILDPLFLSGALASKSFSSCLLTQPSNIQYVNSCGRWERKRRRGYCCDEGVCASLYACVCLCARSPTFSFTWAISSNTSHNPFQLFSTMTVIISPAFQLAVSITCRSIKR